MANTILRTTSRCVQADTFSAGVSAFVADLSADQRQGGQKCNGSRQVFHGGYGWGGLTGWRFKSLGLFAIVESPNARLM
jgi:hypothetical protein